MLPDSLVQFRRHARCLNICNYCQINSTITKELLLFFIFIFVNDHGDEQSGIRQRGGAGQMCQILAGIKAMTTFHSHRVSPFVWPVRPIVTTGSPCEVLEALGFAGPGPPPWASLLSPHLPTLSRWSASLRGPLVPCGDRTLPLTPFLWTVRW